MGLVWFRGPTSYGKVGISSQMQKGSAATEPRPSSCNKLKIQRIKAYWQKVLQILLFYYFIIFLKFQYSVYGLWQLVGKFVKERNSNMKRKIIIIIIIHV
jgi:hypothetical protein